MKVRKLKWRFYRKRGGGHLYGRRCKEDFPGCIVCDAYHFLDTKGRFPTFGEVEENRRG